MPNIITELVENNKQFYRGLNKIFIKSKYPCSGIGLEKFAHPVPLCAKSLQKLCTGPSGPACQSSSASHRRFVPVPSSKVGQNSLLYAMISCCAKIHLDKTANKTATTIMGFKYTAKTKTWRNENSAWLLPGLYWLLPFLYPPILLYPVFSIGIPHYSCIMY